MSLQRNKMRRRIILALPLLALLYIFMPDNASMPNDGNLNHVRSLLHAEPSMNVIQQAHQVQSGQIIHQEAQKENQNQRVKGRPVIYTFFQLRRLLSNKLDLGAKPQHEKLLETWKQLWKSAGWEPRVLTLQDAERHPDYKKYTKALHKTPTMKNVWAGGYDHLCFVRWLAMATVPGGGFMADYDTFPMGMTVHMGRTLPNNGEFTSYGMHVPALLSGTQSEWERMAQRILTTALQNESFDPHDEYAPPPEFNSDMYALLRVQHLTPDAFHRGIPTYSKHENLIKDYPYKSRDEVDCKMLKDQGILAVHLSHSATERAIRDDKLSIPRQLNRNYRDVFARRLTKLWRQQCHPNYEEILGRKVLNNPYAKLQNAVNQKDTESSPQDARPTSSLKQ